MAVVTSRPNTAARWPGSGQQVRASSSYRSARRHLMMTVRPRNALVIQFPLTGLVIISVCWLGRGTGWRCQASSGLSARSRPGAGGGSARTAASRCRPGSAPVGVTALGAEQHAHLHRRRRDPRRRPARPLSRFISSTRHSATRPVSLWIATLFRIPGTGNRSSAPASGPPGCPWPRLAAPCRSTRRRQRAPCLTNGPANHARGCSRCAASERIVASDRPAAAPEAAIREPQVAATTADCYVAT